jgi:hypothetical protein
MTIQIRFLFFLLKYIYFCLCKSLFSFSFLLFFVVVIARIVDAYCVIRFCKQASITYVYTKSEFAIPPPFFFLFSKRCTLYSINTFESRNNRNDYYSVLFVLFEYMSMYVLYICRIKLNV